MLAGPLRAGLLESRSVDVLTRRHGDYTPETLTRLGFVSSDPVDFAVQAVGLDSGKRPSKKQLWSVNPSLHVIDIDTDQGPLQLGLQSHQVDTIRTQLQPAGPPS